MRKYQRILSGKEGIGPWLLSQSRKYLLYLLIFLIPTQLGKHFWPAFSFINGIRIDYLSPTLYTTDILIIVLTVLNFKKIFYYLKLKFNILFATFFLILCGALLAINKEAAFYGALKLFEIIIFTALIIINVSYKQKILQILAVSVIFQFLITCVQFFGQRSIGGIFYYFGERAFNPQTPGIANASLDGELMLRPYGTFSHPNVLAGFCLVSLVLILLNLKGVSSSLEKFIYYLSIICGSLTLMLSMSRIPIVLWIAILVFFIFRSKKQTPKITRYFQISLILAILTILLFTFLRFRFDLNWYDSSVVQRLYLADASWKMILENPLLGVGLNNFLNNLGFYFDFRQSIFLLQPVHNIFLLTLSQVGIAVFSIFLYAFYKVFVNANWEGKLIILAIVILGILDHYLLTLQQGQLLLGLSFAFALSFPKMLKLNRRKKRQGLHLKK